MEASLFGCGWVHGTIVVDIPFKTCLPDGYEMKRPFYLRRMEIGHTVKLLSSLVVLFFRD